MTALKIPHTGMVTIEGRPLTRDRVIQAADDPEGYKEHLDAHEMKGAKYPLALNPRRKKNMARSRRSGKYSAVWNKYGQKGFGIPTMAPKVGSYPLYPINRAQFALVLIAGPAYDKKKGERTQIAKRALAAHPSLKSFWAARKKTINARLKRGGSRRMAANPRRYGRAPARGHAEAAMRRDGFYDFEYAKKGTIPGLGPVLAYTAYDTDGVEHRVNVGRIQGADDLEVRAISIDRFSR